MNRLCAAKAVERLREREKGARRGRRTNDVAIVGWSTSMPEGEVGRGLARKIFCDCRPDLRRDRIAFFKKLIIHFVDAM